MDVKKNGIPEGIPNSLINNVSTANVTSQRIRNGERKSRKEFIETTLRDVLKVKRDFENIKYGRDIYTDEEYMRVTDIFGGHITINITNLELYEILNYACWIVLNGYIGKDGRILPPDGVVTDRDELRKLAPLFKN